MKRDRLLLPLGAMAVLCLSGVPRSSVGDGAGGGGALKANLDLPFDAFGESEEEEEAPEIVVFFGQVYEGSAVVFSLDESGSMTENQRWQLQMREVNRAISELSDRAEFGVVFYGSTVSTMSHLPLQATGSNKARGTAYVTSRSPQGDTCLGEGAVKALEVVRRAQAKHRMVILTSDGHPDNCATGNAATSAEIEQILRNTVAANPGLAVRLHTIWVGTQTESEAIRFMQRLAQLHGGSFKQVSR